VTGCQNTKECGNDVTRPKDDEKCGNDVTRRKDDEKCGNDVTRRKDDEKCGNPAGDLGCGGNLVSNGKGNPIAGSLESAILCVV